MRALAPRPEAHQAAAAYYSNVPRDHAPAYLEDSTALALAPATQKFWPRWGSRNSVSADSDAARATWNRGPGSIRARRAWPRTQDFLLSIRQYPEAERAFQRALSSRRPIWECVTSWPLRTGAGRSWRVRVRSPRRCPRGHPTDLVATIATYQDLAWVLDDAQQALRCVSPRVPSAITARGGASPWRAPRASGRQCQGANVRRLGPSDIAAADRGGTQDAQLHTMLGRALAICDRRRRQFARVNAASRSCRSQRTFLGPYLQHQLALIYMRSASQPKPSTSSSHCSRCHTTCHPPGSRSIRTSIRSGATRGSNGWRTGRSALAP